MTALLVERDRKRLSEIIAIVKPTHSLAAKLETLTDDKFDYYTKWSARYERWIEWCKAQHNDEIEVDARPYAYSLEGRHPLPTMRSDVEVALFGEYPRILKTDSEDEAARKYQALKDGVMTR